jgi:hypothetical protein
MHKWSDKVIAFKFVYLTNFDRNILFLISRPLVALLVAMTLSVNVVEMISLSYKLNASLY